MGERRRAWVGLAVLALPCFVYAMDLTVLELALPRLSADLHPSATEQLWIVDVYGFLVAGLLVTMGTLGDRLGRRRVLLVGAGAFAAASLLATQASTPGQLIAARALLGVAGATIAPSTLALIRSLFADERRRTAAIGIWVAAFSAGATVGPLVGGALLAHFDWQTVFLPGVPVMIGLLVLGPRLLPEARDPAPGRLDPLGAVLSTVAVLALVFGIKRATQVEVDAGALAALGLAAAAGAAFVARQRRQADPLVDLALLRSRRVGGALGVNALAFFAVFGFDLLVAQDLQLVLGLSPWRAGLWLVPSALAFVVGGLGVPPLAARLGVAQTVAGGLAFAAAGMASIAAAGGGTHLGVLVAGSVVLSLGTTAVVTLSADLAVGAAPAARAGGAAAMNETSSELGGALGLALLGTLGTALYRHGLDLPGVVPGADTLPGALAAAAELPAARAEAVADAARAAFATALEQTALVAALILLVAAIAAAVLLRDRPPVRALAPA